MVILSFKFCLIGWGNTPGNKEKPNTKKGQKADDLALIQTQRFQLMEQIDPRLLFSRPRPLQSGSTRQVIRFDARPSRAGKSATIDCVLKFFSYVGRSSYDKEIAVYQRLSENTTTTRPKFRGCDQWSREKYLKTVGRVTELLSLDGEPEPSIFVIMLDYIQLSRPLSTWTPIPVNTAKLALSALAELHKVGIVHGDISPSNILVIEDPTAPVEVVWIDFASSWTDASPKQITWECDRAAEYFSHWVNTLWN